MALVTQVDGLTNTCLSEPAEQYRSHPSTTSGFAWKFSPPFKGTVSKLQKHAIRLAEDSTV